MFYASFNRFNDISQGSFDGTVESLGDTDPFEDSADQDPTGLENDLDALEEANVIDQDDEADELTEDVDMYDVEIGETLDEDVLNEVDLDFDENDLEPDWDMVEDAADIPDVETDISEEDDDSDTQLDDDSQYDQWSEVSPYEEIDQWDDILEDDQISQLEETGYDEPLFYPDEADMTDDPTNEAEEDISYVDHRNDVTDDITDEIEGDRDVFEAGAWVDSLEDFLDFTEADTSSFHEVSEGYETEDGYDPPYFPDEGVDLLELSNFVDDVFADIFPDPINDPFAWFDSF